MQVDENGDDWKATFLRLVALGLCLSLSNLKQLVRQATRLVEEADERGLTRTAPP